MRKERERWKENICKIPNPKWTQVFVHFASSNGFSTNSDSSLSVESVVVLSECAAATRGALRLALAPVPGGDCGRTSDIGRFGNKPSLPVNAAWEWRVRLVRPGESGAEKEYALKSTPPGAPGVVPFAPAIAGESDRTGGLIEVGNEFSGGDTGEAYDGGELVSDGGGGVAGLPTSGGVAGLCVVANAAAEGVVLSMI